MEFDSYKRDHCALQEHEQRKNSIKHCSETILVRKLTCHVQWDTTRLAMKIINFASTHSMRIDFKALSSRISHTLVIMIYSILIF